MPTQHQTAKISCIVHLEVILVLFNNIDLHPWEHGKKASKQNELINHMTKNNLPWLNRFIPWPEVWVLTISTSDLPHWTIHKAFLDCRVSTPLC